MGEEWVSSYFYFLVVNESIFNGILTDFWRQGVDLNGFDLNLLDLPFLFESKDIILLAPIPPRKIILFL